MVKTVVESERKTPVFGEFDVVVVGGGCAGFCAAVAATRSGARTLVVERFPYFGGTATASLMANINGFRNQVEPDGLQTTRGIGEEIMLRMIEAGAVGDTPYEQRHYPGTTGQLSYSYAIDTERFKYESLKMVVDAGVSVLFHTWFADVLVDAARPKVVSGIVVENKSGRQAILARVVIDATGDGDVAARAGAAFWQTRGDEAPRLNDGLMYRVSLSGADAAGRIPRPVPGPTVGPTMVLWGPGANAIDSTDAAALTQQEIATRLAVYDDLLERQRTEPGLAGAKVVETPPLLGIRQTRFVEGVAKITGSDVLAGIVTSDSVAMGASPIIHYYGYRRYLHHDGYGIPYGCLVPREVDGLLVAGRCMSSDQRAYESWRSMATVMSIGEAAGTAAALAATAETGGNLIAPRDVDTRELRRRLGKAGAEVGEPRGPVVDVADE